MNHLTQAASPYLQQHAENPVDWYPWGPEALAKAKQEDKPILLSIGYSACHWCHVMAHESFEDQATAEIMNKYFINIKVDREERPDLDKIYQMIHQLLNGRGGGWPLTVFLAPDDHMPFFTGTYFPKQPLHGLPAFQELLLKIAGIFQSHRQEIRAQGLRLQQALQSWLPPQFDINQTFNSESIVQALDELNRQYDKVYGGFGSAPKFPMPTYLKLLLRENNKTVSEILTTTLTKMAHGGIYDQLGGGFYRYSVDARWEIPHFEKMLYDNAQLLTCYAQANLMTNNELFRCIIGETVDWALREMHAPEGGFYSTLDADSEHQEGKFYVWDREEIKKLLTADEFKIAETYYGLNGTANFENHWHLHATNDKTAPTDYVRKKLFQAREQRVRPGRDDKIIASWNALMIKGLALAGFSIDREDAILAAQQCVDFIRSKMQKNNRLYSCYKDGQAYQTAYLDDYAFLLDALLTLLQVRWRSEDLQFAIQIAEILLTHFYDVQHSGFFFTANDHETLIYRPKPLVDEAVPSGNGIACQALIQLGFLLAEPRYLNAAESTLKMAWETINTSPPNYASLLIALEQMLGPTEIIILRGEPHELAQWQKIAKQFYKPQRMVFAIPSFEKHLPTALQDKTPLTGKIVAYICKGLQCQAPITELEQLKAAFQRGV